VIVVDACVWTDSLTHDGDLGEWARDQIDQDTHCLVTEHTRIEVANSIRGKVLQGKISQQRGRDAIDVLGLMEMDVVPTVGLLSRVWELHANVTAYDAAYVAIAERIGCPLVTSDLKLVGAPGPQCEFRRPKL
jgi:predicted nucleic acid-binding protein